MIPSDLLDLLRCPVTRKRLVPADGELLQRLNARLGTPETTLRNVAGERITTAMEAALVSEDGTIVYPVRDGIPVLLADEAIPVE